MTKILIYSDLHIGATRVDLEKVKNTLDWINMIAQQKNVSLIINLGDTFDFYNHTKSKMRLSPKFISELNTYGNKFNNHLILRGNHEFHEEGDLLEVLSLYGAKFVNEPFEFTLGTKTLLMIPYGEYDNKVSRKCDYLFTHCDIKGAKFESGFEDESENSDILNNVSYNMMFDGHYHIKQTLKNIYFVGATQSRVKSNNVEKMGITIFDLEDQTYEFIENPYADYEISDKKAISSFKFKEDSTLMDELDNFKLEKTGVEVIENYLESKKGIYEPNLIDYVLEYIKGGMK